ncbi:MAG TPA: phosphoribosyl-ATP diphosphatase [Methanocorpusculum sp.]|nr:phosphoribosyl-ATP diphosphatase [Methanocorpusculum sp.]
MTNAEIFDELWDVICSRAEDSAIEKSYVRTLLFHKKGIDKSLEKVGEEAAEFIIACKNNSKERIIEESADVIFHLMVALKAADVDFKSVEDELEIRRRGMHLHD